MDISSNNIRCTNCGNNNNQPYAKARDIEYFTSDNEYQYYLCNDCEVLFIYPQPLNELQQIYPGNYYSFNDDPKSFSFKIKNTLDRIFFKKHLSKLPQTKLDRKSVV